MSLEREAEEQKILPYERPAAPYNRELRFGPPSSFKSSNLDSQPSISAYLQIIVRRRWTVLSTVVILVILVAISSYKMKPVYKATARVEVDAEPPQIQSLNDAPQLPYVDPDFLRTQIQVLKTDNLAWRTIEGVKLDTNPNFAPPGDKNPNLEYRKGQLIERLKGSLGVELLPATRIIQISFESTDPALAAQVVNAHVENYLDYNFRQKFDSARQASGRMEQQLDELKAKVEKSQKDLIDYQRRNAIVNIDDKQSVVAQRLAELSSQQTAAQSDRIQKEALYTQIQNNPEKMAALAQNELLQRLEEQQAGLKKEYVETLSQYGPTFPKVIRLQKQVDAYQTMIDKERVRFVDRLRRDYGSAVTRQLLLTRAVNQQKDELGAFNKLLVQQNFLKGEFETNQKLYERLLEHLKDATIAAGLKSTNIHLVDAALIPSNPIRPRKSQNIAISVVVGLMLGVLLAFLQESLDHTIKSLEEVEALISVPALAAIPLKGSMSKRAAQLGNGPGKTLATSKDNLGLEILTNANSPLSESYRALRTATLLSMAVRSPQIVLVTSANPGEGKTTTAINLALTLAQQQGEVLLVDCDLRKPKVAAVLGLETDKGLSTILTGRDRLQPCLQKFVGLPNLWVLPAGPLSPNPADLLSSVGMGEILRELQPRFRHIIIDSPPLLLVTDATILSTLVDGVIVVVAAGATSRNAALRISRLLHGAGARILGVVLNKANLQRDVYHGYDYGGYYGNGSTAQSE